MIHMYSVPKNGTHHDTTRVRTMVPWYIDVHVQHYLKNDLKYKHSGATGKLVSVVSIEDITVYYGSNSTAMSAARISATIIVPWYVHVYVHVYVRTYVGTYIHVLLSAHVCPFPTIISTYKCVRRYVRTDVPGIRVPRGTYYQGT